MDRIVPVPPVTRTKYLLVVKIFYATAKGQTDRAKKKAEGRRLSHLSVVRYCPSS